MNFKIFSATAAVITLLFTGVPVAKAAEISVQIHGQVLPGVYGQIGFAEPVERYRGESRYYVEEPQVVYVEVPHKHRRHWQKHCRSYRACHQRVYFVEPRVVEYREHRHYRERDHHRRYRDHH